MYFLDHYFEAFLKRITRLFKETEKNTITSLKGKNLQPGSPIKNQKLR